MPAGPKFMIPFLPYLPAVADLYIHRINISNQLLSKFIDNVLPNKFVMPFYELIWPTKVLYLISNAKFT